MTRASETRSTATTSKRGWRLLLKIVAWMLAVPALCAAVLVGGAVPLYLLLPDAKPAAETVVEAAQTSVPASRQSPPAASSAEVRSADAGTSKTSEAISEAPTGVTSADAAPDEGGANAPAEVAAATVIPTPRPVLPLPDTRSPSVGETREMAAVEAVSPPYETMPPRQATPDAVRSDAPLRGRRMVVRTAAKLRAAPQGAEIGVLREGTEVAVGRCGRWCEVSSDGRRGFVHASLIDDGTRRGAEGAAGRRVHARPSVGRPADERRIERQRDLYDRPPYDRPAYARRDDDRRFRERAYRRDEDPDWLLDERDLLPEEPDWYVEDERPIARGGPPAILYYEPYP